jgi:HTH-type transcriptional regulator / antitoxin HipB
METRLIDDVATLGARCRANRLALGLSLSDAALAAGVNYRFASELENGKPSVRLNLALRYATSLGIEILYRAPVTTVAPSRRRVGRSQIR